MSTSLIAHFADASDALQLLNLEDEVVFAFSLAFNEQMKYHQPHPVEKPDTCPHLKLLAERMPTYGRQTL